MRAVGYCKSLPITDPEALIDIDLPDPTPNPRDLLVRVKAVSVNPVDVKVRAKVSPPEGEVRVLGFDAAGVVEAVGSDASLFKPGDEVYYSGSIARPGTDAEFHVVDERIVGRKPASLTWPCPSRRSRHGNCCFTELASPSGTNRRKGRCSSSTAQGALALFSFSLRAN